MERHKTGLIYGLCSLLEFRPQKDEGREGYAAHHEDHNHHEEGASHLRLVVHTGRVFPTKNLPLVPVQLQKQAPLICTQKMAV
jgi:hypothetical protein